MFTLSFVIAISVVYILDTFVLVPKGVKRLSAEHILKGDKQGYVTKALKLSVTQIKKGQIWRLFSSTLLHVGLVHLLSNIVGFSIVSFAVESVLGPVKTMVCYIISGFVSALIMAFHFLFDDGEGASTGIYGLIAVFFMLAIKSGTLFFSPVPWYILLVLGIYFVGGMCIDQINRREHVTGFIGGLIASIIFVWLV